MKDLYYFRYRIKNGVDIDFTWYNPFIRIHLFSFRGKDFYKRKYKIAGNLTKNFHFMYTFGD